MSFFSRNGNPKKLLIFQEATFQAQEISKIHLEKFRIISWKKAFLLFQKTETSKKFFKILYISGNGFSCVLGKVYSEPSYIQNPDIFRTIRIFKTLVHSEPKTYSEHCQTSTMEPLSISIKNFLIFSLEKAFLIFQKTIPYISGNGTLFWLTWL